VAEASDKLDETTKTAKETAKEAKDTAKDTAEDVKDTAEERARDVKDTVKDTAEKAQDKVEPAQTSTDEHSEVESLPQTPLGGTDPMADGAPSFAKMTAEPAHGFERNNVKNDEDAFAATEDSDNKDADYDDAQLPHTPLGGTDPTANKAPSFAQAVAHKSEHGSHQHNEESADQLPQTPFGGTDPMASGAPSYAQASAE